MFASNSLPTRWARRDGHVVLGDLRLHRRQLGDERQIRLVRLTIQRRLAERAVVRGFHVNDARDRVTRWSLLEGERPLPRSSTGWFRVSLGRLAAVRRHVSLDLPLKLLYALLQAGILFNQELDLCGLLGNLGCLLSKQLE